MAINEHVERYASHIERSFRDDAIRTAMLIDDQFPDYLQMQEARHEDYKDLERARKLYGFLHQRGLICDVQNWRGPGDADFTLLDKVRKSDLIVLDYQLGQGPEAALRILRHLAESPHFNLVVLYTADDLRSVALAAASAMRGLAAPADNLQPSEELLDEAREILNRDEFKEIDAAGLARWLAKGETPWAADLKVQMGEAGIGLKGLKPLADHIPRSWLRQLFGTYGPSDRIIGLEGDLTDDATPWIRCGSCFVALVGKAAAARVEDEGGFVWSRLGLALRAWRPNIYRLILSEIQNALELEAIVDHEAWLDDKLCLGLGLYLLESEELARGEGGAFEAEGAAHALIDRFVDLIRRRLATRAEITARAAELLTDKLSLPLSESPEGENARHARARELAHVPSEGAVDWRRAILPTVNAFMISHAFRGSHLTTGTVLRDPDERYWLCTSPACDLVPRRQGYVGIQVIELSRENAADNYTHGDKIVVVVEGEPIILRALHHKTRLPQLEILLLPTGTNVEALDGCLPRVRAWLASQFVGAPGVAPTEYSVISQLRNSFATRFLMVAGQHLSRIGVDFIDP